MLRDVNAAWDHFRKLLLRLSQKDAITLDKDLAAFVSAHRGAFESRLLDGVAELAAVAREFGYASPLAVFFDVQPPVKGGRPSGLDRTLGAADPLALLRVHARARLDHGATFGAITVENSLKTASWLAERAGRDAVKGAGLPPEFSDHLCARVWGDPLPDILPAELPDAHEIELLLSDYVGVSVPALAQRMRAEQLLHEDDQLGEIIARDAETLRALGTHRHVLAQTLESLLGSGQRHVLVSRSRTPRRDPFHSADATPLHGRGAHDFQIVNRAIPEPNVLQGGDLLVILIRRAGFFGGNVSQRLDPTLAARVLIGGGANGSRG